MNLLEHESKPLLAKAGITTPQGVIVRSVEDTHHLTLPVVLKSQVPIGGRGKAGGIKLVRTLEVLPKTIEEILALPIKGFTPKSLLAEEVLDIKQEFYLSLTIDRATKSIQLVAHKNGGVEVEENHDFKRWPLTQKSDAEVVGQQLADYYELPSHTFALQDLIEKLFTCFVESDATLIEINPLILSADDQLIAGDCKMTLDDAASFRHDWQFEAAPTEANFVTINQDGNVATIANGAGLAMATVDAAYDAGLTPANFLDIGGGATSATLLTAFSRIAEYSHVKAIIINIFAGITQSDEVAKAIIEASANSKNLPPLFIRIAGTNYDQAAELLKTANIPLLPSLDDCLAAAKEVL